jgi:integrase
LSSSITEECDNARSRKHGRNETQRVPWNKGKLIGAKPPLRPKHVWSIRTKLQVEGRTRDLAMFNLAIDSKLRGCDVVALKVEDVAPSGYAVDRATVRQKKTGQPVRFELTEQTRQAVDDYVRAATKKPGEFMFTGRPGSGRSVTTRQYARLVSEWIASIGPRPSPVRYPLAAGLAWAATQLMPCAFPSRRTGDPPGTPAVSDLAMLS